jgi:hypothetical protein
MVRCESCGSEFTPAKRTRRFCSRSCSNRGVIRRHYTDGLTYYERHRADILARRKRDYVKERTLARIAARRAVPLGPCEVCGSTKNVVRHHDDYGKPLDVRLLCRRCHAFQHGRAGVRRT